MKFYLTRLLLVQLYSALQRVFRSLPKTEVDS